MSNNHRNIPYMGGKHNIGDWIVSHFPAHTCYLSLMGGSGSDLYAKPRSKVEIYNDKWDGIVTFFEVLREYPEDLKQFLELVPYSRMLHKEWSKKIKNGEFDNPLEKAASVFYLLCSSFDGEIGAGFKTSAKSPQAPIYAKKVDNIVSLAERFRGVIIENLDFRKVIPKYDSPETLIYADPPYLDKPRDYYVEDFTYRDHWDLAKFLQTVESKVIVSYYPTENTLDLYPEDHWFQVLRDVPKHSQKTTGEAKERATEVLFLNFEPKEQVLPINQKGLSEAWF